MIYKLPTVPHADYQSNVALLIKLAAKEERIVICRTFPGDPTENDYIILTKHSTIVSNIETVSEHAVFWWTPPGSLAPANKAQLYTTDCQWLNLYEAIACVIPVKMEDPDNILTRLVLKGFELAPQPVLDEIYDWCHRCHQDRYPSMTEVLSYMNNR